MERAIRNNSILKNLFAKKQERTMNGVMERAEVKNLTHGQVDRKYEIKEIRTSDEELRAFLFTLGCYEGEHITIISTLADNYVINVKDARYSIDTELAAAILI